MQRVWEVAWPASHRSISRDPSAISPGHLLPCIRPKLFLLTSVKSDMVCRARGRGRASASFSSTTINDNVMGTNTDSHCHTDCQHCVWGNTPHSLPILPHPPTYHHSSECAALGALPPQSRLPHMAARHDVTADQSDTSSPVRCCSKLPTGGRSIGSFSPPARIFLLFHSESLFYVYERQVDVIKFVIV